MQPAPMPPHAAHAASLAARRVATITQLITALRSQSFVASCVLLTPSDLLARFGEPHLAAASRGHLLLGMSLGRLLASAPPPPPSAAASASAAQLLLRGTAQLLLEYEHWAAAAGLVPTTAAAAVGALLGSAVVTGSDVLAAGRALFNDSAAGGGGSGGGGAAADARDEGDGFVPISVVPLESVVATQLQPPAAGAAGGAAAVAELGPPPRLHRAGGGSVVAYECLLAAQLVQPFAPSLGFVETAAGALGQARVLYERLAAAVAAGSGAWWGHGHSDALERLDGRLKTLLIKPLTLQLEAAALAKLAAGVGHELAALASAGGGGGGGGDHAAGVAPVTAVA